MIPAPRGRWGLGARLLATLRLSVAAGSLRHLPYLFERLYRAEAAWDRAYEWAGIGLAISHSIVRAHGGTVTVDSAGPDHSAVFTVELSLVASNRPQPRLNLTARSPWRS